MNRTRIAIVGLALLATACTSGNTGGTATPGTTETKPTTSSESPAGNGKLASIKPCELISSSEATELGLTGKPEAGKSAGAESCDWSDPEGGLTVAIEAKQGADEFNYKGATKEPAKFGKYEGYKVAAPDGTKYLCDVVLSVTDSSSVQIVASASPASTDTAKACGLATKSAELIATKLP